MHPLFGRLLKALMGKHFAPHAKSPIAPTRKPATPRRHRKEPATGQQLANLEGRAYSSPAQKPVTPPFYGPPKPPPIHPLAKGMSQPQQPATPQPTQRPATPVAPASKPTPPAATPPTKPTGPAPQPKDPTLRLEGMAAGIIDNFYDAIKQAIDKTGDVPKAEAKSLVGQLWKAVKGSVGSGDFIKAIRGGAANNVQAATDYANSVRNPAKKPSPPQLPAAIPAKPTANQPQPASTPPPIPGTKQPPPIPKRSKPPHNPARKPGPPPLPPPIPRKQPPPIPKQPTLSPVQMLKRGIFSKEEATSAAKSDLKSQAAQQAAAQGAAKLGAAAGAAGSVLVVATGIITLWNRHLQKGMEHVESLREFRGLDGGYAAAFARQSVKDIQLSRKTAEGTSGTGTAAVDEFTNFKEAMQPLKELSTNVKNIVFGGALAITSEALQRLNPLIENLNGMLRKLLNLPAKAAQQPGGQAIFNAPMQVQPFQRRPPIRRVVP